MKAQKQSKVWYKKWWAITLFVIFGLPVGIGVVAGIVGSTDSKTPVSSSITSQSSTKTTSRDSAELNVHVQHDDLNMIIQNKETKDLGNCRLNLNDKYEYDTTNRYLVNAGQEVRVGLSNFTQKDGTRFNIYTTKPQYLRINCDRRDGDSGSADIFWN